MPDLEAGSDEADQVSKHFENTMSHIKVRQENGEEPTFKNIAWLSWFLVLFYWNLDSFDFMK